jgi:hypothetical protein
VNFDNLHTVPREAFRPRSCSSNLDGWPKHAGFFEMRWGVDRESKRVAVYTRCMSTRTQIYLTDEQRRCIKEVASAEGVSMAEVIRRALDGYLDEQAEPDKALAATFG